jgi:hypothetical protein
VAFFIAVVLYGQVRLMFGLTPRHIAMVVMLIACMRQGVPFPMGRIMKTYFVFVFTFLVSATVTGYLDKVLITYYIAACAGYWATNILITKYKDSKLLLKTIVVLGVLNAIVTIGQTLNMSFSDQIVTFFHLKLPDKYIEVMDVEGNEDMALMLTRPGLFAGAVYNGYFHMTSGIASLMLLVRKFHIHRIIPWLIIMLGCICVQERGPIIILAVLSAFAFYRLFHIRKNRYALLLIVFALAVYYLTSFISLFTFGRTEPAETHITYIETDEDESDSESFSYGFMKESRLADEGFNDPGRERIYRLTIDYLMDYPLIGGLQRLRAMYGIYPHNLFLLAFAYGGFIGGLTIILILFWQFKPLWRVLRRKIADTNPVCFFTGLAYVAYTLNSLVHNRSIVTGDEVIWILWATFYFEYLKYFRRDTRL